MYVCVCRGGGGMCVWGGGRGGGAITGDQTELVVSASALYVVGLDGLC